MAEKCWAVAGDRGVKNSNTEREPANYKLSGKHYKKWI